MYHGLPYIYCFKRSYLYLFCSFVAISYLCFTAISLLVLETRPFFLISLFTASCRRGTEFSCEVKVSKRSQWESPLTPDFYLLLNLSTQVVNYTRKTPAKASKTFVFSSRVISLTFRLRLSGSILLLCRRVYFFSILVYYRHKAFN